MRRRARPLTRACTDGFASPNACRTRRILDCEQTARLRVRLRARDGDRLALRAGQRHPRRVAHAVDSEGGARQAAPQLEPPGRGGVGRCLCRTPLAQVARAPEGVEVAPPRVADSRLRVDDVDARGDAYVRHEEVRAGTRVGRPGDRDARVSVALEVGRVEAVDEARYVRLRVGHLQVPVEIAAELEQAVRREAHEGAPELEPVSEVLVYDRRGAVQLEDEWVIEERLEDPVQKLRNRVAFDNYDLVDQQVQPYDEGQQREYDAQAQHQTQDDPSRARIHHHRAG